MPSEVKKVIADRIAAMQWAVIKEAVEQCVDVRIVASGVAPDELAEALTQHDPDILILGNRESEDALDVVNRWMLSHLPSKRVLTLFDGPGDLRLSEWRLSDRTLTNLSISALCQAIEGRR